MNLHRLSELGYPLAPTSIDLTYMQYFAVVHGSIIASEEAEKDKNSDKKSKNKTSNSVNNSDKVTLNDRLRENKVI